MRQDLFIQEYSKTGNATQSAIRAGYSPNGARVTGHRLVTNTNIQQRIKELGYTGLDTLNEIALHGKNEIARVSASKILIEMAFGKPKSQVPNNEPLKIVFNKLNSEIVDN
ncbi:MAG: terminase small subunit [Chryseobacterium sp.]